MKANNLCVDIGDEATRKRIAETVIHIEKDIEMFKTSGGDFMTPKSMAAEAAAMEQELELKREKKDAIKAEFNREMAGMESDMENFFEQRKKEKEEHILVDEDGKPLSIMDMIEGVEKLGKTLDKELKEAKKRKVKVVKRKAKKKPYEKAELERLKQEVAALDTELVADKRELEMLRKPKKPVKRRKKPSQ